MRENIIESARFAPARGKYKVFILDEVHMLSGASFNALLKTLEEPPAHAIFILATTELHKIPATILSRCQRFDFHRVPPAEMIPRLQKIAEAEGVAVEAGVLASIARLSEGCLRDAESLLGQLFALGEDTITAKEASLVLPETNLGVVMALTDAAAAKDIQTVLRELNAFVDDGGSVKYLIEELLEYVRTMMFSALGFTDKAAYDPQTLERLAASSTVMTADGARRLLDLLLAARTRQSLSAFPQLPLEIALVEFCADASASIKSPSPVVPMPPVVPSTPKSVVATPQPVPAVKKYDFETPSSSPLVRGSNAGESPLLTKEGLGEVAFTLEEIQNKWGRCVEYVAERNVAIPLIMKNAKPTAIEGNTVVVSCEYVFHADAISDGKNRRLIEDAIEHVMMAKALVRAICENRPEEKTAVDEFVSAFGASAA
ncbi:MAG: polymerase III, subunit gamma and tau protein [Candidatus Uhrbacteria bacterium GW2011_GWD2_52_7]|uniref:Polymerase III, subunit gamma and tau protein n=1 Tax=Candidatus Uhrbacteria bacterium GW2011_GWD2_52_7 TaxID=1618989 RepID=A0A0G1XG45_9BACT|nr:MAG: polymerase III, subunit gamma and tau protein [Candidatus Uhrbacteria bacterium GW2011_GWD2_52_7]